MTSSSGGEHAGARVSPSSTLSVPAAPPTAFVPRPTSADRLTRRQDFGAIAQHGRRVRHRLLTLGFQANGLPRNRYGYAIGKRVGNAVTRNLVRRRLREIVRLLPLAAGYDIVVTARPEAARASFDDLSRACGDCARRGGILMAEDG